VVLRFLYQRILASTPSANQTPLIAGWSVLDACEVAATLLFAMVFVGVLSGYASDWWTSLGGGQWGTAAVILLSYLIFCSIAGAVALHRSGLPLRQFVSRLGLSGLPAHRHVGAALAGYSALVALVVGFALVAHSAGVEYTFPATESAMELLQQLDSVPAAIFYFLLICVLAPVVEECLFRGFIYAGLRSRLGPTLAVVGSSAIFGATHLRLAMGGMVAIACVGMLLSLLYERHRTLWPSIFAHALHNLLAFAVLLFMNI
jgi:membrane protease YdiL (CAAX protease family)